MIGDCETYEEQYNLHKDEIETKRSEFEHFGDQIDDAEMMAMNAEPDDEVFDNVAPTVQDQERRDREQDNQDSDNEEDLFTGYDIGPDIGMY